MGQTNADQLIDHLYATAVSAVDACVWCDLLPGFCSTFGAAAGGLVAHDFVSGTATLRHSYDVDRPCDGSHEGHAWGGHQILDPVSRYREGAVFVGEDIASHDAFIRSDLYRAHFGPRALLHQLCGMITRHGDVGYLISLVRPADAPPFDGGDKEVLTRMLPHLKRSLQLRDEVVHGRVERESLLDLVDQLPVAVLLVTRSGLVKLRNHAAEELLGQRDAIRLRSGYLAGSTGRATAELRRLVANAATCLSGVDEAAAGEHFVVPRGPDRLPLVAVAYAGRGAPASGDGGAEPIVVLLIKDPQADTGYSLAEFIKAYNITAAEARLIRFLSEGHGLFEAARELGITRNTARTHMRNIYAKVGTHRQSDLVRLLYRFNIF